MRRRVAAAALVSSATLLACTALLGVKDVYFDPSLADGSAPSDGPSASDGPPGGDSPSTTDAPAGDAGDAGGDGAACGDTQTDPLHCGRCNHSCLGGACSAGKCQPVEIARGPVGAYGVAVDTASVYWTSLQNHSVHKAPKADGGATTLAQQANGVSSPSGIFVEGGFVYWTNFVNFSGTIMRCPVAGCGAAPQIVVPDVNAPTDVTVDGTRVYVTEYNGFQISSAPKAGADAATPIFATSSKPEAIALDGDHLVWIDDGSGQVHRIATDGGDLIDYGANGFDGRGVAVDSNNVYWVNLAGNVSKRSKDGGGATQALAVGEGNPLDIVVDGTNAYWIKVVFPADGGLDLSASVRTCALAACTPADLATGQKHPRSLAMDSEAIYWVNFADGAVMKVAKP
jgi:hypothetical protein